MSCDRRTFLKTLGLGAGALGAGAVGLSSWPLHRSFAAPSKDHNFIFAYFNGGWDQLLCLDPRDPEKFKDKDADRTKIELAWDRLPSGFSDQLIQPSGSRIVFGPAIGKFARHYDKSCVVRGIAMDTVTHVVGRRYFLTGMAPRGSLAAGSSVATRIVAQQGNLRPLPNLVARLETYNDGLASYASGLSVSSVDDLIAALEDGPQAPSGAVRTLLDEYRAGADNCDPVNLDDHRLLTLLGEAQKKSREMVAKKLKGGKRLAQLFRFEGKGDAEMTAIAKRYGITDAESPQAQAAMAFQALKYGLAQCVSIELARKLDTHSASWATTQPTRLREGFDALGTLVDDLARTPHPKGGKLLDRTTILAFSEFARTPRLNNRDGRDHHLASSALLIGARVPHNKVIGGTSDRGMNALTIDPHSGQPRSGGVAVTPTRVIASLMKSAGCDIGKLRVDALPCLTGA